VFLAKLSVYPRSKLRTLLNFSGYISGVWKYLDEVSPDDDGSVRADLGYSTAGSDAKMLDYSHETNSEMAKDFGEHHRMVASFIGDGPMQPDQKKNILRAERDSYKRLQEKYPNAGIDEVLQDKRFYGLDDDKEVEGCRIK